ncbi:MAG: CPBP family intramembrane metalloprotease [Paludibacteraceae bacterium]|nr:CPBP family intramembrane metalloprotease [Paludibacteraceae bacterium]
MDLSVIYSLLVGQDILLFILPAFIIARWKSRQPVTWLQMAPPKWMNREQATWAVLIMVVLQPAINLLGDLNSRIALPQFLSGMEAWMQKMEAANAATTDMLLSGSEPWQIIMNFLVVGVLAAFSEEMLFRGALQGWFSGRKDQSPITNYQSHIGIWAAAILFSCMHLQFYGFIPRMLMGALFGYAMVWCGSLYIPMMMHMTNNVLVVLLNYIVLDKPDAKASIEAFGTGTTWWVGLLSLALGTWMIYHFYRICKINLRN